jgi:hypothetical protein
MAWPSRLETIFLLGISFTRRARLPSFCDLNILVDLSADRVVHAFSISSIPIRLSALSSMSARTMKLKRTRYVCSPPVGPVRLSNQSSPADPPLRLSESQMRKTTGVDLSPELWLCKLCLGAIDSSYDSTVRAASPAVWRSAAVLRRRRRRIVRRTSSHARISSLLVVLSPYDILPISHPLSYASSLRRPRHQRESNVPDVAREAT